MTLKELRFMCLTIQGIDKVRIAKLKDGIFLYYKEVFTGTTFWKPTDFIHLDSWKDSIARTKAEYERFYKL